MERVEGTTGSELAVSSCAFVGCADPSTCCLVDGCVNQRFGRQMKRVAEVMPEVAEMSTEPQMSLHGVDLARPLSQLETEGLKASAPALNGTKPRPVRDPSVIKRNRKAIRP